MINRLMIEISQWNYSYLLLHRPKGAVLVYPLSNDHLLCLPWSSSPPFSSSSSAHQFSISMFTFLPVAILMTMLINIFLVTSIPSHLCHDHTLSAQDCEAHLLVKAVVKLMINLVVGVSFIHDWGPNRKLAMFPAMWLATSVNVWSCWHLISSLFGPRSCINSDHNYSLKNLILSSIIGKLVFCA